MISFLLATTLIATQPATPQPRSMTRAEVEARVQSNFARTDANRDGFVTQAEAQAQVRQRVAMRAQKMGRHARPEAGAADLFTRLDTNKDSSISRAEFDTHRASRVAKMRRRGGMLFGGADKDRDGRISQAEAMAEQLAHFDRLDANRDGTVTLEERRARRAARPTG